MVKQNNRIAKAINKKIGNNKKYDAGGALKNLINNSDIGQRANVGIYKYTGQIERANKITESRIRGGREFDTLAEQNEFYAATVDLWLGNETAESRNQAIIKGLQARDIPVKTLHDAIEYIKRLFKDTIDTYELETPAADTDKYNTEAAAAVAARL